jgi:uncharacterized delta-60 repeat protein
MTMNSLRRIKLLGNTILILALTLAFLPADRAKASAAPASGGKNSLFMPRHLLADPVTLDPDFGSAGFTNTDVGDLYSYGIAAALQSDGKIVLVGSALNGNNFDFALARYNGDGSLDTGFGTDGIVLTDFKTKNDMAVCITLQAGGKILVAGNAFNNNVDSASIDFALARYNSDGNLDTDRKSVV